MSNEIVQLKRDIDTVKNTFTEANDNLSFQRESSFAIQALQGSEYLAFVAMGNRNSLRSAVMNVASIGLSLNPALGHAYLVPRDGKVILDVSYKGLIELGTRSGGIIAASAEMVYSNDSLRWNGKHRMPDHDFDPFGPVEERGSFRGVYAVAQLPSGEFLLEKMSAQEIEKVKGVSQAHKAFLNGKAKSSIWDDWFEPMCLKSVIKKGAKTWPGQSSGALQNAIQYLNQEAGEGFASEMRVINPDVGIPPERQVDICEAVQEAWVRGIQNGATAAAREWITGKYQGEERIFALSEFDKRLKKSLSNV